MKESSPYRVLIARKRPSLTVIDVPSACKLQDCPASITVEQWSMQFMTSNSGTRMLEYRSLPWRIEWKRLSRNFRVTWQGSLGMHHEDHEAGLHDPEVLDKGRYKISVSMHESVSSRLRVEFMPTVFPVLLPFWWSLLSQMMLVKDQGHRDGSLMDVDAFLQDPQRDEVKFRFFLQKSVQQNVQSKHDWGTSINAMCCLCFFPSRGPWGLNRRHEETMKDWNWSQIQLGVEYLVLVVFPIVNAMLCRKRTWGNGV